MNDAVHCTSVDCGLLHVLVRSMAINEATGTSNVRGCRRCCCVADHEDCSDNLQVLLSVLQCFWRQSHLSDCVQGLGILLTVHFSLIKNRLSTYVDTICGNPNY
jgi:hypothetical protein